MGLNSYPVERPFPHGSLKVETPSDTGPVPTYPRRFTSKGCALWNPPPKYIEVPQKKIFAATTSNVAADGGNVAHRLDSCSLQKVVGRNNRTAARCQGHWRGCISAGGTAHKVSNVWVVRRHTLSGGSMCWINRAGNPVSACRRKLHGHSIGHSRLHTSEV